MGTCTRHLDYAWPPGQICCKLAFHGALAGCRRLLRAAGLLPGSAPVACTGSNTHKAWVADWQGPHLQGSQALKEPRQVVFSSRPVDKGQEDAVVLGPTGHRGYNGLQLRILGSLVAHDGGPAPQRRPISTPCCVGLTSSGLHVDTLHV